jgi:O-antigen ligase
MWVISPIFDRIATQLESGNADVILTGRLNNVWLPLLPEVMDHPILGQGRLAIVFSAAAKTGVLWRGLVDPHSGYLELLLDGGIVGLALVLGFWIAMFRSARRLAKRSADPIARRFGEGFSLALVAYAISSLTGLSFYPSDGNVFVWVMLGVLVALHRFEKAARAPEGEERP